MYSDPHGSLKSLKVLKNMKFIKKSLKVFENKDIMPQFIVRSLLNDCLSNVFKSL